MDVIFRLEGEGPLNQRVYRGVRRAILAGRIRAGERMPSTRSFAFDLGVSRNVVLIAFEQLAAEGYLEGRVGSGTFVSAALPDAAMRPWKVGPAMRSEAARSRLSTYGRRAVALAPIPAPGQPRTHLQYDFRYGVPAIGDFPHDTWSRLVARRARAASVRTLQYGRTLGFEPLRRALAAYLTRSRGVVTTHEHVVIVNGSQQALDLVARLFVDRGDRVLIEEPCYQGARQVFQAAGARLVPTPVDEAGLDVSRLPRAGTVRLVYVTPSHQFPLGGVMPLSRRLELLRWADEARAVIVEDDYDSEFRYEGRPVEAVQGLDRCGRVVYVGTFSKVLFPSLRLGYVVVPEPIVPAAAAVKFLTDVHSPTFEQEVLTDFIVEGHFERHLRRSRTANAARRAALLEALADRLGDRVEVVGANAGVHVVVWLRGVAASRMGALMARAAKRGLGIHPVTPYYLEPPRRAGLLVGYASLTVREIREGVKMLSEVLAASRRHAGVAQ
jgi:GntR family transcriptional regulator/MocR family aminotransferase